jgi:hypothetical protein
VSNVQCPSSLAIEDARSQAVGTPEPNVSNASEPDIEILPETGPSQGRANDGFRPIADPGRTLPAECRQAPVGVTIEPSASAIPSRNSLRCSGRGNQMRAASSTVPIIRLLNCASASLA